MRFNCQSCGAKYQIADEKVAGKTVRMKCRKCGQLIQVRAQKVGEGVQAAYTSPTPSAQRSAGPAAPRPTGAPLPAPRPSRPGAPVPRPSGASLPRPRPSGPGPRLGGPPRPGASPGRAPAVASSAPQPEPPGRAPEEEDMATVIMARPSYEDLSGAGARGSEPEPSQAEAPASDRRPVSRPSASSAPQWFVGIDGEPVGPVDPSFIKAQIEVGKVTAESLVWREELTDWKPLQSFAELRELLAEPEPAPAAQVSDPVALTRVKEAEPAVAASDPAVQPAAAEAAPAAPTEPPPPEPAQPPAPAVERSGGHSAPSDAELAALAGIPVKERRSRSRGMHPMAYAFIAMAAAFGAVAAWVLFGQQSAQSGAPSAAGEPNAAAATAADAPDSPATAAPSATAVEIAQVDVGPGSDAALTPNPGPAGKAASSTGATEVKSGPTAKPCTPDDPFCGNAVDGPSADGPSTGGDGSGQGLTPAQAQAVVNQNRHAVSRKCMGFVTGKGGSAKVFVTIVVAPSGAVQSASVSGGNEYPGLASCVRSRVSNWRFPQSGASTTVNVSFNFLAQ